MSEKEFHIATISRTDLKYAGYDITNVDNATMERLASALRNAYMNGIFWIDLPILADSLHIPKQAENAA